MSIVAWIVMGLVAGFVASRIVDRRGRGVVMDVVLGVGGALLGGFLFRLIGSAGITGFDLWSVLVATMGAGAMATRHLANARGRTLPATPVRVSAL